MSASKNAQQTASRRFKPADLFVLIILVLAFLSLFLVLKPASGAATGVRVITPEKTFLLDLHRDQEKTFSSPSGSLTIKVESGKVRVTDSTCRDRMCVKHAPISRPGERIICLPSRITVEITGDESVDASNF